MAATGYTPISLYYSTTASAVPVNTNLVNGELAVNITDGKLYYKNNSGVVTLLANSATVAPVTTFSAGTTGFTPSTATSGAITLAGTLNVANGGTGAATLTGYVYGNGTSAMTASTTIPTSAISGNFVSTFSGGTTGLTPSSATAGAISLAGTLAIANGGTNSTATPTAGTVAYGTGTAIGYTTAGTSGQVLTSAGAGTPTWTNPATGTVSTVSVVSANGFAGTVATATTTPAITLSTSITGVLKGNATAISAATAGTDYAVPTTASTWTTTQTFNGSSSVEALKVLNIAEPANVVGSAPSATTNFYVNSGAVQYYTTNAANNWTLNIAFSSGTTLNTAMATNDSISITMLSTQGSTAYYNSAVTIDGVSVTPKWQGGSAPTSGNASGVDSYTYVILKTAASTYLVLASQTKFA
jgi:hypothetical protein